MQELNFEKMEQAYLKQLQFVDLAKTSTFKGIKFHELLNTDRHYNKNWQNWFPLHNNLLTLTSLHKYH